MPIHLGMIRPLQDRVAGELAAIVADNHSGPSSFLDDPVKFTGNPQPGQRGIGDETQAFPGTVVDDRQNPEPAAIGELIPLACGHPACARSASPPDRAGRASCGSQRAPRV